MRDQVLLFQPALVLQVPEEVIYLPIGDVDPVIDLALAQKLVAGEGSEPPGLPLASGTLVFDATHRPDWRVFEGIFIAETYAADYQGSVVIDIGAHRGLFAAYALQEGCSAVLAYEPEPANFAFLERNVQNFSKEGQTVRAYPQAVGSRTGTTRFFVYDQSWSHSVMVRTDRTPVAEMDVEQVAFEHILAAASEQAEGRRRIIVKIDADGQMDPVHVPTLIAPLLRGEGKPPVEPLYRVVDAERAMQDGLVIAQAGKTVYVTDEVPATYLSRAD